MKVQEDKVHPADRTLIRWNSQHPNEKIRPLLPNSKTWTDADGTKRGMSEKQYDEFAELAGKTASALAKLELFDTEEPTTEDVNNIKSNIQVARREAKKLLVKSWKGDEVEIPTPETLARRLHRKNVVHHASVMARAKPKTKEQQTKWEADVQESINWLKRHGGPVDYIETVYREALTDVNSGHMIKSPVSRNRALQRYLATKRAL